jgi:hypothetical protein
MNLKKQLMIGAILMVILICFLIEMLTTIVERKQILPPGLSGNAAFLIAIFIIIYTMGLLAFGVWVSLSRSTKLENWNKRYTLIATIPAYFGFALLPVFFGLILVALTDQTTRSFWLSCLSFPTVLIFLLIEIRKLQS